MVAGTVARMILLIDNYDSFTFNLYQALASLGEEVQVVRNDAVTVNEVESMPPPPLVLSPGPCPPKQAGISLDLVEKFYSRIPLLGICLGHQAIAMAFGGRLRNATRILHGKTSRISHLGCGLFDGVDNTFTATRYHSLAVEEEGLPRALRVTARSEDQEIMGLEHCEYPVFGVQFHPESVLTTEGHKLLENFVLVN